MTEEWISAWEKTIEMAEAWADTVGKAGQATMLAAERQMELMTSTYARLWGEPAGEVMPADSRFQDEVWRENVAFDLLKQIYLITAQWLVDMADGLEGVSPDLHKQARFWAQQYADALSPSNFAVTNPEVLQEITRTGGTNLLLGMQNLLADLEKGQISMVPDGAFKVGTDLAVTPGKVVYRNPLIELIQYTPATEQVREIPILAIPPWINKYYIMDLQPENSMYQYLVEAGFTVFTISWKNPDDSVLELEWADYMEMGPMKALEVIRDITGAERVNTLGYCLGGILQSTMLAYMAAKGEELVNSATFFATHQDFSDAGDVDVFISRPQVRFVEWLMELSGGYLDGRNMGATFNILRANDLLWHYVVQNYLLGQKPTAFDLLFWNSDGTRVPAKVHSFLLREFFLGNKLREPDGVALKGVGIDTRRVTTPAYAVACERDHIVPWRGASKVRQLLGGPVRFVLAESGHIAGIINHPDKKRRGYWTNDADDAQELAPDEWLAGASKHQGSWWVDWIPWLEERSGALVEPPSMGNDRHPPIMDAPGAHVLEA